ncbi:hypothetical protein N9X28_01825 [Candidatus Poseidoniales archaeon]|nr:hypothetical protein [Candidatus Poseidoniales archaeon]MDB2367375.1 hypothetical protein [Candidatus Poseidoniales archaeon]MDB2540439.1 hypothetical protein [Candidatus Poseidoniales archaeon]|tara:strand:- start:3228 stop:3818 length:591 start_codon:yes stop_codon:yes gene_type:complete
MKSDESEETVGASSLAKKWVMRQYWRIQQSQTIISMIFWVTTITLLIWPYVQWRFNSESTIAGISATYWGLAGIGATVIVLVLVIGVLYDAVFGLWREHLTIVGERNPFQTYQMSPNLMIMLLQTNLILRRLSEDDEDILRHCDFVDRWYKWNVDTEIFARTMEGWESIVKDEDPFLPLLTDEERQKLAERVENLN